MEAAAIKPKVSVCVVTYNHEKYIRQCLQSIVNQKTDFDFELIVGEDCSTDGTRAIVQEFVINYPDIVKPIYHNHNIGATLNYFSVHKQAIGEYVAHVDGDDYWLQNKLQYQSNLLDERTDFIFVADYLCGVQEPDNSVEEFTRTELFIKDNPVLHSSKLYRSKYIMNLNTNREYIDFEIHLRQLGAHGRCGLSRKTTTIHRYNSDSSVRNTINIKLVAAYIGLFDFAASIGIDVKEINKMYDIHMRSFIKLAAYTNDRKILTDLINIINTSPYSLRYISKFYLFLIYYNFGTALLRCARKTKSKLHLFSHKIFTMCCLLTHTVKKLNL